MKKILSYFICFCFVFNYVGGYYLFALESLHENQTTIDNKVNESKMGDLTGNLELDLKLSLPIQNTLKTDLNVKLTDLDNNTLNINIDDYDEPVRKTMSYQGQNVEVLVRKLDEQGLDLGGLDEENHMVYIGITVYGIKTGNYTVSYHGDGYRPFYVSVTLDDYSKRVSLSNTAGMFEAGEVNDDNTVNDIDKEIILKHFESEEKKYDLNRDGVVDVADLNYITAIINGEKESASIVDTSYIIDTNNVKFTGTDVSQNDDGSLSFAAMNEGEITEENPASLDIEMDSSVLMSEIRLEVGEENVPEEMDISVELEDGTILDDIHKSNEIKNDTHNFTDKSSPNTIVIDLGKQVAVKRVTIKVTKSSNKNLAEIAKVDFLNNVYEEVPKPNIEKPTNVNVIPASEKMTVTFDNMSNVTGYEILLQEVNNDNIMSNTIYQTTYNTFTIEELDNYQEYYVSVQSVNGDWRSEPSDIVSVTLVPNRKPPKVDMVVLTPVYAGFNIGWKSMKDTLSYNLYYKEESESEYTVVKDIKASSYELRNLKVKATYQVYITGNNDLGESESYTIVSGETKNADPTIYPKYKLINTSNGYHMLTSHIKDVVYKDGEMVNGDKFSIVDDDHLSYWYKNLWDAGGGYYKEGTPIIVLDQEYKLKDFVVTVPDNYNHALYQAKVFYYDGDKMNGSTAKTMAANIVRKTDSNGRIYFFIKCLEPITTSRVQIALSTYSGGNVQMSEVKIYEYDSLEEDVAKLFKDDLRVELNSNVNIKTIEDLEKRANTIDENSNEYHYERDTILKDLEYAKQILNDTNVNDVIEISPKISNQNDKHLGFAMSISDYQPLGIAARAGEELVIYVGSTGNVMPELVFTQYYAEANKWNQTYSVPLHKGQNIVTVPTIGANSSERGGSVYVRYPKATGSETIKIRVSGGEKIPYLNLYNVTDESTRKSLIEKYITELKSYVNSLEGIYSSEGLTFNKKFSVLNSTEIATDEGLFSIPATATYEAISKDSSELNTQVNMINESTLAFDEMVNMFYRHKGLSHDTNVSTDKAPTSRINIRYMKMFDGAFMYAGGLHIGIEYESTKGLLGGKKYESEDFNGYFGWGISHEIGHQINQGKLATAEVTNNVYALLAQTANDKSESRLEVNNFYPKIYEKVTSGTTGKATNVFVSLGMYWQLHLAYDDNLTFTDRDSIYSRINKLSRSNNLSGTKDELLIMYASDAAGENLIPFFEKWGYVITQNVRDYINSKDYKDKYSKAIWYLNDEARRKRINNVSAIDSDTLVTASFGQVDTQNKRITLNFSVNKDDDKILGYEIIRNGEVIMFTTENTFTDIVGALNNQAVTYKVVAYDYLLNKTKEFVLDEVKVSHDGSIVKDNFDIESNYKGESDNVDTEKEDFNYEDLSVKYLIDGDESLGFNGSVKIDEKDSNLPYIIIDLNSKLALSGIKYKALVTDGVLDSFTITDYQVYVSTDREKWILAKEGTFDLNLSNDYTNIVYFDKEGTTGGNQLYTYNDISYVKIVSKNNSGISGSEIDLIAPPGDDVSLDESGYGILESDYYYNVDGEETPSKIEKGSVVFTGKYRGNPAFNVVILVDADTGEILFEEAEGLLFAELTSEGTVYDVHDGYWVFAMSQEEYKSLIGKNVRAELYRVDDPLSLDGQRLTSTSLSIKNLPEINELHNIKLGEE